MARDLILGTAGHIDHGKTTLVKALNGTTLLATETHQPPAPRKLNRCVPQPLSNLVMRLPAKKPADRPASARAVADELRMIESQPAAPRRRLAFGLGLIALLGTIAVVVWGWSHERPDEDAVASSPGPAQVPEVARPTPKTTSGPQTAKTTPQGGADMKTKPPALVVKPTGPMTLRMTIVSKGTDVPKVVSIINRRLEAGWKASKIVPAHYADDYEFIRRASLDIIGRIATPAEIRLYLKDPVDQRRSLLIERLLKHEDYTDHWANLWSNWLLTRSGTFGRGKYHNAMTVWLSDRFAENNSYADITKKLITATGKNDDNGATNFILAHLGEPVPARKVKEEGHYEMVPLTSRLVRVFLGVRLECARCHPHPDRRDLTQQSFWGVNAFLRQVNRSPAPIPVKTPMHPPEGMRSLFPRQTPGFRRLPTTLTLTDDEDVNPDAIVFYKQLNGKVMMWSAEFLRAPGKERGPRLDRTRKGLARREALAGYLIDHEMFPKAIVNRIWAQFMGRGFVNPVDDFNDTNPPSNPELLNELAERFKHYNYDIKKLIRWITHSNAYHLSHVANPTNDKPEHQALFSRMVMRPLSLEQLFESLMTATCYARALPAARRKELRNKLLTALSEKFGEDEGNEAVSSLRFCNTNTRPADVFLSGKPAISKGPLSQALLMMNGKDINDAISHGKGAVALIVASRQTRAAAVIELYLAALNRPPKQAELRAVMNRISLDRGIKDSDRAQYEDLLWALLNSNEFLLNH